MYPAFARLIRSLKDDQEVDEEELSHCMPAARKAMLWNERKTGGAFRLPVGRWRGKRRWVVGWEEDFKPDLVVGLANALCAEAKRNEGGNTVTCAKKRRFNTLAVLFM